MVVLLESVGANELPLQRLVKFIRSIEPSKEIASTEILSSHGIQNLKCLLSHFDSSSSETSNFVKASIAFTSYLDSGSWIMTGSFQSFLNYSPCLEKDNVRIVDSSCSIPRQLGIG